MRHVSEESVRKFLGLQASREQVREVVHHLLTGCPDCLALAYRIATETGLSGPLSWEDAYEQVFARALAFASEEEQRLALESLRGWAKWATLEPMSPQLRFLKIESDPSYHTWGVYERLLEAGRGHLRSEPAEAVDIVHLAVTVAEKLDPAVVGEKRIADLQASAWAALGNAKRVASDFEGAQRAFNEAWCILEKGTGDPLEEANLISLEASYMNDLGEFETAEASLGEALEIYQNLGDPHMQGRTLLKMGDVIGHVYPERGLTHIRKALVLIDPAREARLLLCAEHDLAWYLNDIGQPEEALASLNRARPLYRQFPDRWTQLRLHWLEGRIAFRLGDYPEAETIFTQLWDEFRARDLHHELVLLSIDLAEVLVAKGEYARAEELIGQCHPILASWGLHRYALAAWLMLQRAIGERRIGAIFGQIREYYRRYWVRPSPFGGIGEVTN